MEVNENRGRLCRKKLQGKIRKKKNHQKEKDITGSVKRANHNKGSMIVWLTCKVPCLSYPKIL